MLLYFKTKTCIQIEHSNIKLIFITYLSEMKLAFETDDEGVLPAVASEMVHIALADIRLIARHEACLAYGDGEESGEAQRGDVAGIREAEVVVVVKERENLVVRLPVLRREHHPHDRRICLQTQREGV